MPVDVSVAILNYRSARLVRQLLRLIQSFSLTFSTEVVVVDNASPGAGAAALRDEFPEVHFIQSPRNLGYAAGNNLALAAAAGRYILVLNPDVVPSAAALDELYRFLELHPKVGVAGPKLLNADGSYQLSCGHFPDWRLPLYRRTWLGKTAAGRRWLDHHFMRDWDHAEARAVDWLFGAALAVRREAIQSVGQLDERFFLYFEDMDWCRRFWSHGWEVWYVPSSTVVHFHQRTSLDEGGLWDILNPATRVHIASWLKYLLKYRLAGRAQPDLGARSVAAR